MGYFPFSFVRQLNGKVVKGRVKERSGTQEKTEKLDLKTVEAKMREQMEQKIREEQLKLQQQHREKDDPTPVSPRAPAVRAATNAPTPQKQSTEATASRSATITNADGATSPKGSISRKAPTSTPPTAAAAVAAPTSETSSTSSRFDDSRSTIMLPPTTEAPKSPREKKHAAASKQPAAAAPAEDNRNTVLLAASPVDPVSPRSATKLQTLRPAPSQTHAAQDSSATSSALENSKSAIEKPEKASKEVVSPRLPALKLASAATPASGSMGGKQGQSAAASAAAVSTSITQPAANHGGESEKPEPTHVRVAPVKVSSGSTPVIPQLSHSSKFSSNMQGSGPISSVSPRAATVLNQSGSVLPPSPRSAAITVTSSIDSPRSPRSGQQRSGKSSPRSETGNSTPTQGSAAPLPSPRTVMAAVAAATQGESKKTVAGKTAAASSTSSGVSGTSTPVAGGGSTPKPSSALAESPEAAAPLGSPPPPPPPIKLESVVHPLESVNNEFAARRWKRHGAAAGGTVVGAAAVPRGASPLPTPPTAPAPSRPAPQPQHFQQQSRLSSDPMEISRIRINSLEMRIAQLEEEASQLRKKLAQNVCGTCNNEIVCTFCELRKKPLPQAPRESVAYVVETQETVVTRKPLPAQPVSLEDNEDSASESSGSVLLTGTTPPNETSVPKKLIGGRPVMTANMEDIDLIFGNLSASSDPQNEVDVNDLIDSLMRKPLPEEPRESTVLPRATAAGLPRATNANLERESEFFFVDNPSSTSGSLPSFYDK